MTHHILDLQAIEEEVSKKGHNNKIDDVMEVISRYYICMLKTHIYGFNNGIIDKNTIDCAQTVMDSIYINKDMIIHERRTAYAAFTNDLRSIEQYIDVVKNIEIDDKNNILNTSIIAKMRITAEMLLATTYRFVDYYYD